MKRKAAPLYFEIHNGSSKPCGYIRSSFRKNGKVSHETLSRINGLSLEKLQAMKAAFDGKHFTDGDVKLSDGREFGASAMLHDLAQVKTVVNMSN
jgi:hypothetical protein